MTKNKQLFREYLLRQGLNMTKQREVILDKFLRATSHPSVKEIYHEVRTSHPQIGLKTVHRNLKLFAEFGIAEEWHFGDGIVRYEPKVSDEHHNHFICTACGTIANFKESQIEKLQKMIAQQHGFKMDRCLLALYGMCARCSGDRKSTCPT